MLGAIIGGIASAVIGSAVSAYSANRQMSFQRNMSNTSYQRAMTDMKAAGLNPMLAYQQGGASTPGGSQFQGPDIMKSISSAVSAKRTGKLMDAEYDNIRSEQEVRDTRGAINVQQYSVAKAEAARARVDEAYYKSSVGQKARIAELAANSANAVASVAKPWVGARNKPYWSYGK